MYLDDSVLIRENTEQWISGSPYSHIMEIGVAGQSCL